MKAPNPLSEPPRPRRLVARVASLPLLWAWPLMLSLVLVVGVMGWLRTQERADREAQRAAMISDALSLEAQVGSLLDGEIVKLKALAEVIQKPGFGADSFTRHALVLDGLRHFWISVTWLSADGRIVAHVPDDSVPAHDALRIMGKDDEAGLAGHLSVSLAPSGGHASGLLVARYAASALLRQNVPWWLASKYDIRLVDASDEVIAATVSGVKSPSQAWYRVPMGPSLPQAWLELAAHERITPWWRTLPVLLMCGFLSLLFVASAMLRRQMRSVSRAEEAWRTEVAWRTAMEDSLAVGIRARDLHGRLVYVNKTMADMVGYQPEELVGLLPPMPYWVPGELEQSMSRHLRNMAGNAPRDGYESRWQHRDGSLVEVMVLEAPLVDAHGQKIGWMASVINITERKRMAERERKQLETMAHHARLTMLGEVASTLAHELNQPLTAIASYNAGVLNALENRSDIAPAIFVALQRMGEQAGQAGRIVKRIREFLTRREPVIEACDLAAVIESALALLERDLKHHQIRVDVKHDAVQQAVMADLVLIEQVVVNLIRNACDALQSQMKSPMRERHICITTQYSQASGFARVTVADNGPGLAGQSIQTLCAPFHSSKPEGMGMGLAICRSIVELHYGALDAQEAVDGGAIFSFSLPLLEAQA
ncbi:MAG: PAS domain S-box protein [Aquabacterium sp.]|nr:PAS domain S-box protein [Aquabacterium sp.]